MVKFQLYYTDEYNQSAILMTSTKLSEVIKEAKNRVTDDNVNNSLTVADKQRNWESYFVEIPPKKGGEPVAIHAGRNRTGNQSVYLISEQGIAEHELSEAIGDAVKIYLGKLDKEDWYATDGRNNLVESLDDNSLEGKAVYYIKAIES
tara:strand:- start:321 stop:764 length:444 start_codon:yes stop_codon:yes gene_type:complete